MVWLDGRIEQEQIGQGSSSQRLVSWRCGVGCCWVGSRLNGEKREVLIYLELNGLEDSLTSDQVQDNGKELGDQVQDNSNGLGDQVHKGPTTDVLDDDDRFNDLFDKLESQEVFGHDFNPFPYLNEYNLDLNEHVEKGYASDHESNNTQSDENETDDSDDSDYIVDEVDKVELDIRAFDLHTDIEAEWIGRTEEQVSGEGNNIVVDAVDHDDFESNT
ncbi:hypothetical protein L6452_40759 [Arctium lappa]|uniref:Uncharacterized protein n=1 Tax=Arctium lappa TaxID=4217 RepID=A0ACB8XN70_ARCLA|nr:hypothetical protein L6452_40759 [Arctium lappa]